MTQGWQSGKHVRLINVIQLNLLTEVVIYTTQATTDYSKYKYSIIIYMFFSMLCPGVSSLSSHFLLMPITQYLSLTAEKMRTFLKVAGTRYQLLKTYLSGNDTVI